MAAKPQALIVSPDSEGGRKEVGEARRRVRF